MMIPRRAIIVLLPLALAACGRGEPCTPKKRVEIVAPSHAAVVSVGRVSVPTISARPSVPLVPRPATPPPPPRPSYTPPPPPAGHKVLPAPAYAPPPSSPASPSTGAWLPLWLLAFAGGNADCK